MHEYTNTKSQHADYLLVMNRKISQIHKNCVFGVDSYFNDITFFQIQEC